MICLHPGAHTHKHTEAHTNMIVCSYFEYLVNMEQIGCFSKAIYFDTQKRNFTNNEKILLPDKWKCYTHFIKQRQTWTYESPDSM